jgi:hypothetical protein
MARDIIETSLDQGTVEINVMFGVLMVKAKKSGKKISYDGNDVKAVEVIDAETHRSGGRAVLGAVVGGVLTGGIGFLAGAAFGGRKRHDTTYVITFNDDEQIAFSENRKKVVKYLHDTEVKLRLKSRTKP